MRQQGMGLNGKDGKIETGVFVRTDVEGMEDDIFFVSVNKGEETMLEVTQILKSLGWEKTNKAFNLSESTRSVIMQQNTTAIGKFHNEKD